MVNAKRILSIYISFNLLSIPTIYSQSRIGDWNALTSFLEIRDILLIGDTIYSATEGGILELSNNEYSVLTTVHGLEGVNISSIEIDFETNIWIGGDSPNGFIQVYNTRNRSSTMEFDFGLSSVVDINLIGNTSWVLFNQGQESGIMKFTFENKWQFRDSYTNFPFEGGRINCFSVNDSTIFLGTSAGIYFSDNQDNLKDPNSWNILIPSVNQEITSIEIMDESLFFSSINQIYKYGLNNQLMSDIHYDNQSEYINNLLIHNNNLWFTDGEKLNGTYDGNEISITVNEEILSMVYDRDQLILGTTKGYKFIKYPFTEFDVTNLVPNSPFTSRFSALTILNDGRLVAGSGSGISIFDNDGWRNILEIKQSGTSTINEVYNYDYFIGDTVGYDFGEYIADLEQGPDGLLYCAIRGSRVYSSNPPRYSGGVIVLDIDDPSNIYTIDTTFLSYFTTSNNSRPYQVTLDIEFDEGGNLWIANPYCTNGNNPIHVRSVNGSWKHYGSSETSVKISQSPVSIEFDSWGRTWISAFIAEEANLGVYPNGGVYLLTFEGNPYEPLDFSWQNIINSGTVWSLGSGLNNRMYYLTPTGLNYFDLDNGANPIIRENDYPYFPNISFGTGSGLKIDANGNIWTYSPTHGLHILLENTSYWPDINGFRSTNSPLLSDEVVDIEFDEKKNLAYIATGNGINVLRIPFGNSKNNFSQVKIFPSPFYITSQKNMVIDNLPYGCSMMITTLDGKLVVNREYESLGVNGDQIVWDGKNNSGDYVSTGVYLVHIYGPNGSNSESKITVVKK